MSQNLKTGSVVVVIALAIAAWFGSNSIEPALTSVRNLGSYQTTSSRISSLSTACSGFSRQSLSTSSATSSYYSSVNASLGVDGISVVSYLVNGKQSEAQKSINNASGFIMFIMQFFVGLVVIVVISPFLMCCCCCPGSCPSRCCCRKDEYNTFTSFEIRCPIVTLLIALAGVIACSVYVLASSSSNDSFKKNVCAFAVTYDDALNGNSSKAGNFFIGINPIPTQLGYIKGNLTSIDSNLAQLYDNTSTTTLNQAITQAQTTETDIIKISNDDAAGNDLNLNYNTPLDAAVTTSTIASTFPSVLGSYKSKSGIVWGLYQTAYALQQTLSGLKTNATTFHNTLTNIDSSLNSAQNLSTSLNTSVNSNSQGVNNAIKDTSQGSTTLKTVILIVCIVAIVLSALTVLVVLCMCSQKKDKLRCLLYLLCFLIFLLTLICFLVAVFLSVLVPFATWGCEFTQNAFKSNDNFLAAFYNVTTLDNRKYIASCLPFGDGDILSKISTNASASLALLNGILNTTVNFNSTSYTTPISTSISNVLSVVNQYALSQIVDITDTTSINKLLALQNCNGQSNCNGNCNNDSWVPSNSMSSPNTYNFTCSATNNNKGNSSTCPSGISSTSGGCSGCMDSAQSLFYYLTPSRILLTDLSTRYGATCTFNNILNNVWTNYYKLKETALGPTVGSTTSSSGVYPRASTVNTDFNTLLTKVNNLNSTFTQINSGLGTVLTLVDPNYGLFASLNCKVLGQDVQNTLNLFCGPTYDYIYVLRIGAGILAYFLSLSLCCIVCVGSRNARLDEEGENYITNDNQMNQVNQVNQIPANGFQSGNNLTQGQQYQVQQPQWMYGK